MVESGYAPALIILIFLGATFYLFFRFRNQSNGIIINLRKELLSTQSGKAEMMLLFELENNTKNVLKLDAPQLRLKTGKIIPFPITDKQITFPFMLIEGQTVRWMVETDKSKTLFLEAGCWENAKIKGEITDQNGKRYAGKNWITLTLSTSCRVDNQSP